MMQPPKDTEATFWVFSLLHTQNPKTKSVFLQLLNLLLLSVDTRNNAR